MKYRKSSLVQITIFTIALTISFGMLVSIMESPASRMAAMGPALSLAVIAGILLSKVTRNKK